MTKTPSVARLSEFAGEFPSPDCTLAEQTQIEKSGPDKRSILWGVTRLLLSLGLISVLLLKVQWHEAFKLLRTASAAWIAIAVCLAVLTQMARALKWQFLLRQRGLGAGFWFLTKLNFIGSFWSSLMPTFLGGDVMRGIYLSRGAGITGTEAAAATVGDRATGMMAHFAVCAVASLFIGLSDTVILGIFVLALALFTFCVAALALPTLSIIRALLPSWDWVSRALAWLARIRLIIRSTLSDKSVIVKVSATALLAQFLCVLVSYAAARSLHIGVPLVRLFCYVPCVTLLYMLPISLNGWGVTEAAYVCLLSRVGIGYTEALTFSLVARFVLLVLSIVGGIAYACGGARGEQEAA